MHSRSFRVLALLTLLCGLLASKGSAVESACAETIETPDGAIAGSLIGEESYNSFILPWPTFQFILTVETATGYYKLSDGSVITMSCTSISA